MGRSLSQKLRDKGWAEADIKRAVSIMEHAEKKKKTRFVRFLDGLLYWFMLFLMLLGNFVVSVVLIPFLIVLNSINLYIILGMIAITFGTLFTLLVRELDNLTSSHIIMAGVFIPAVAIINVFIITNLANLLIPFMQVKNHLQSPLAIGIVYGVSFTLPYIFSEYVHRLSDKVTGL